MMSSDTLNWHDYGGYTKMTAPSLNVNATKEDKTKRIIAHKVLSENYSTDKSKSKRIIVNEKLSQSCSMNEGESKRSIINETLSQSCSNNEKKSKHSIVREKFIVELFYEREQIKTHNRQ